MDQTVSARQDESTAEQDDQIDLRSLGMIFWRRIRIFLLVAGLIAILGAIALVLIPNQYAATANILLDRQKFQISSADSVLSDLPDDSASVDTEAQVLQSPDLLRHIVKAMKLQDNKNIVDFTPSFLSGVLPSSKTGPMTEADRIEAAVTALIGDIDVERKGLTYVIGLTVTTKDADLSAKVANAIAARYVARQVEVKRAAAVQAEQFLNSRVSGLGAEVHGQETTAQALRARAGLPVGTNLRTYDQQVIEDTSKQSTELSSDLAEKRGQLEAARRAQGNPSALPAVLESQTIRDLKARRSEVVSQRADLANRYGPLHPETRRIDEQLRQINADLSREMNSIVAGLGAQVDAAQQRLNAVQGQLSRAQSAAVANSQDAAAIASIDQRADASRTVYADLLKRAKETAATGDLAKADSQVIGQAVPPANPSFPRRTLLMLVVLAAAGALGLVAIVIAELIDVKLSSGADIARFLGARRLISVPDLPAPAGLDSHALLVTEKPFSSYAEAFRDLADQLDVTLNDAEQPSSGGKAILVTSAVPHEGKTSVAAALALSLSAAGHRVALVDADLRRPQVLASLQIPQAGVLPVDDAIAGRTELTKAMIKVGASDLLVFPLSLSARAQDMFRGDRFEELLKRMREHFDFIVIDTPPVLAVSDAKVIAHLVDGVVYVARWRKTSRFAARAAIASLQSVNAPVLGVVLNAVNLKTQSLYARDDSLSFYSNYKGYYVES